MDLATVLYLFLMRNCSLDPRWMYENDLDSLEHCGSFDFIVVGGGSAGAVIANRLSENRNVNVLLVEAGGYPNADSEIPLHMFHVIWNEKYDWMYETERSNTSCLGFEGGRCRWPRGKMLGGCSSMNGMLYVKGPKSDYDHWRSLGNTGWGWSDVEPFYEKSRDRLKTSYQRTFNKFGLDLFAAGRESGFAYSGDEEADLGFFTAVQTIDGGRRCSTAKAFLSKLGARRNLNNAVNTRALRVLFDGNKAVGVEVFRNGKTFKVFAKKEIILSAGAINSPQLLMLSGIGPQNHLTTLGIKTRVNLPVGRNLQDHFMMHGIVVGLNPLADNAMDPREQAELYCAKNTGPTATTDILNIMWFFNADNTSSVPDLQTHNRFFARNQPDKINHILIKDGINQHTLEQVHAFNKQRDLWQLLLTLPYPKSRGEILLATRNPHDPPLIHPNYLTHPSDLATLQKSIHHIRNYLNTPTMRRLNASFVELIPPNCARFTFDTAAFWECNFRNLGSTVYHPVGTCKMGTRNAGGVVDARLRVHGVRNLRVADASIMPTIVNRNTNAACIMIAEKGAHMIKEDNNV